MASFRSAIRPCPSFDGELVVNRDATELVDNEKLESGCRDGAVRRDHFPVECDRIAKRLRVFYRPEPVSPISYILFMRSDDPLCARGLAARFAIAHMMDAVGRP
jgi:hypothetical protein